MKRKLKQTLALALALSSASSSLPVLASETSNYDIEEVNEDEYIVEVTKADHIDYNVSLYVLNNLAKTYTVDLTPYLDVDNPTFYIKEPEPNPYITSSLSIQSNALRVNINEVDTTDEGDIATLEVVISSNSHKEYTVFVEIKAVNKEIPTFTLEDTAIEWSTSLTASNLVYKASTSGTLSFSQDTANLSVGSYVIDVTFTPTNLDRYSSVTVPINVEVTKKVFTDREVKVELELSEISQGMSLSGVSLVDIKLSDKQGNDLTNHITSVEWLSPSDTIVAGQVYNYKIDSDNFEFTGSIKLIPEIPTIPQVVETPTISGSITVEQGMSLGNIEFGSSGKFMDEDGNTLDGYTVEWLDPSQKVEVGQAYDYIIKGDNYVYVGSMVVLPEVPSTSSGNSSSSSNTGGSASINSSSTTDLSNTQTESQDITQGTNSTEHWANETVQVLIELGILNTTYTSTELDQVISRGEFASLLHKVLEVHDVEFIEVSNTYIDLYGEHMGALLDLTSLGIFVGYGDDTISPDKNITREEIASVLTGVIRVLDLSTTNQSTVFEDDDLISDWAKDKVETASKAGLMVGYTDNTFKPQNNITFAEALEIMNGIIENLSNK